MRVAYNDDPGNIIGGSSLFGSFVTINFFAMIACIYRLISSIKSYTLPLYIGNFYLCADMNSIIFMLK